MEKLNLNAKYLVVVDSDAVGPESVQTTLNEAGISATVLGIPTFRQVIEFYELYQIVQTVPDPQGSLAQCR